MIFVKSVFILHRLIIYSVVLTFVETNYQIQLSIQY